MNLLKMSMSKLVQNSPGLPTHLEFPPISKVSNTISLFETSDDLMKITVSLPPGDLEKDKYRGRISKKGENDGGIHFFQYSQFMNLLNDIHDLEIALRMFQVQNIQT